MHGWTDTVSYRPHTMRELCSCSLGGDDLEALHLRRSVKQFFCACKERFGDLSAEMCISALGLGERVEDAELALPDLQGVPVVRARFSGRDGLGPLEELLHFFFFTRF